MLLGPVAGRPVARRPLTSGIEMHTGNRSMEQRRQELFEKEGFQTHETADRETKRGTSRPDLSVLHAGVKLRF